MKILLADNLEEREINHQPGKTGAEKRSYFDAFIRESRWWRRLAPHAGEWVKVDTKYLFTQSFNVVLDDKSLYDVQQHLVEDVAIQPEFKTIDEWIAAVKKRYVEDWPGTDVDKEMAFWKERLGRKNV